MSNVHFLISLCITFRLRTKMSFNLRIQPQKKSSNQCHMSQWNEREKVKERQKRDEQLKEATEYCIEKGSKGQKHP